ncbi:Efflux pump periplasmic linker BepF [Planctomycetes bacterium Pan216]|uniref:Efflux pump periplasmic linker BepF n=1 Tax=Kolteria novifilia TaxID=2527975 RepID=A0A518BAF6_9BACT|nr:Efflux pump periplasmic linker BepF [Planctomycetes bacterium Pan216]
MRPMTRETTLPACSKYPLVWLMAGCGLLVACGDKNPKAVVTTPPVVEVAHPIERTVTDYEVFTGETQAVQSVNVTARVTGYLTKINFRDGQDVKANDILFEIDDRPYKAALEQAKGEVEYNQANLLTAQAQLDIALKTQKDNPAAISKLEINKRQGLRDEAQGSLKASQAQLADAQLNYDWCKVRSPIDGRTDRHFVDVGNLVTADKTKLTNIVSLAPMWVYFYVDQRTVLKIRELVLGGKLPSAMSNTTPAELGLANNNEFPFEGYLDFVGNQVQADTGSIWVRGTFPNTDHRLLSGLFARIRVPVSPPYEALLVADAAVSINQSEYYVLVVDENDEVVYRPVEVGQVQDGFRQVLPQRQVSEPGKEGETTTKTYKALSPTDRVIVRGMQRVRSGIKVSPKLVDMVSQLPVTSSTKATEAESASTTKGEPASKPNSAAPAKPNSAAPAKPGSAAPAKPGSAAPAKTKEASTPRPKKNSADASASKNEPSEKVEEKAKKTSS